MSKLSYIKHPTVLLRSPDTDFESSPTTTGYELVTMDNEKIINRGMEVIVNDGFLTFQLEINRCISLGILNINIMFLTFSDSLEFSFVFS